MYAAKGGKIFVLGNAAGRPLINAVGSPRVIINGTCLDYLAESFMAGDPLQGGGFVILNGITFDDEGSITELDTPYPGGNLFSLASGGAGRTCRSRYSLPPWADDPDWRGKGYIAYRSVSRCTHSLHCRHHLDGGKGHNLPGYSQSQPVCAALLLPGARPGTGILPEAHRAVAAALGLDIGLGKNAGLYARHRWFSFEDINYVQDKFKGQETLVELKVFF